MSSASIEPASLSGRHDPAERLRARTAGAIVAALCLGLLLVAAAMRPDTAGHGTHTQLGLPSCGWVVAFDRPCPTCGMTTAFSAAAGGRPGAAFRAQPAGFVLAIGVAALFFAGAHTAAVGVPVWASLGRLARPWVVWAGLGLLVAAWVYKLATWPGG